VRSRLLVISFLAGLAIAAPVAGASKPNRQPFTVSASSLTQSAQQLIWTVRLASPFSPAALRRGGRSLCLLIERAGNGTVSGQLCVIGPRSAGTAPRVAYQQVGRSGPGPASAIAATVSRSGARSLTASFLPGAIGNTYQSIRWQVRNSLRPPACTPVKPDVLGCLTLFPAKPSLARLHTPQLAGCVPSGAPFVDNGPSTRRELALTFDDGPWYDTPQFLDVLERYKVPATFFEIGEQISTFGEGGAIERRMLADGDMVGDHTWSHPNVAGAGAFAMAQIQQAADAIRQATHGFTPCLFRAPYGAVSPALIAEARSMGFTTIQWDIDPRDWARPGTAAIYDNVIANAHPGAIVIQHDGGGDRSETLAALPQEITTLRQRGYTFVTVTQLLGQRLIYR
jgi:peptidoglycan/xylan/chitin deacetylase (PgdA/CDA1 family)